MWMGILISAAIVLFFIDYEMGRAVPFGGDVILSSMSVMMAFLSVSLIIYSIKSYRLNIKKSWPHAMGRIERVKIEKGLFGLNRVFFHYSYMVNDREYTNSMFDFAQNHATDVQIKMHPELRGERTLSKLEGKLIKVYYRPDSPWTSAISRRMEQSSLIATIPSVFIILFCLYYLVKMCVVLAA